VCVHLCICVYVCACVCARVSGLDKLEFHSFSCFSGVFVCVWISLCVCVRTYACAGACAGACLYRGWQGPIECPKLQVSFRKRATNYRALLQKKTYKDKAFNRSSPPCTSHPYIQGSFVKRDL